jgi:hypothetical protein
MHLFFLVAGLRCDFSFDWGRVTLPVSSGGRKYNENATTIQCGSSSSYEFQFLVRHPSRT